MQVLEAERDQAVVDLEEERERHAQVAMNLRREVMAVQQSLTDDKERTCAPRRPAAALPADVCCCFFAELALGV